MSEILFVLAGAMLGVEFGWAPLQGGDYEAILQIEPEVVAELSRPGGQQEITSDVPRRLWTARRLRITSGKSEVPRDGLPRAAREADESTFENESIVYLDGPALAALKQAKDVVFTLPANVQGVKRYRIVAGEPPRQPATPPSGTANAGNPLRDPATGSNGAFTNPPYRDPTTTTAGGGNALPPTDRTQSNSGRVLPGPERRPGASPADDHGWSDRWDPPAADPWPGAANAYPRDQYPPPSSQSPYADPYGRGDPYAQAGEPWRDDPRRNPNYANEDPRTWPPGYDPRFAAADRFYNRPGSGDPRTWDEWASRTPPRGYEPLEPPYTVPPTGQGAQPPAAEAKPAPPAISITLPKVTGTPPLRESPHFWPLTFSLLGFFAASGGVIFLGWMNYNFRRQYQLLLSRLRNRRVLATS